MIPHAKASSAIAVICGIVLALGAAQALAAKSVVKSFGASTEGTTGGLFKTPRGVAVNQSGKGATAGTFYVVDSANQRIQMFNPAGEFLRAWGWGVADGEAEFQVCKVAANCKAGIAGSNAGQLNNPQGIAIDQATGNLYVSDQTNRRIDVFGPNGAFQGAFGYGAKTGAAEFQFCTTSCAAPAAAGSAAAFQGGRFGTAMGGLSVDSSGNLYVADKSGRRVDVFKPILSGSVVSNVEFLRAFGWDVQKEGVTTFEVCTVAASCKQGSFGAGAGQFGATNSPADVAVDSEGNVYAVDSSVNKRIQKFSSAPLPLVTKFGEAAITEAFGAGELFNVAVDPSSAPNRVLVSGRRAAKENRVAVLELDALGNKLHLHGEDLTPTSLTTASTGIAVAKTTLGGNLYLTASTAAIFQGAYALNEGPTIQAATSVSGTEATLNGTLVSNDAKVSYRFEYLDGATWVRVPTSDVDAGTSSASALIASTGPSTGTLTVKARGGAFTLSFKGEATAPLAHDASAASVQAALEALPTIGAGNVTVSGGPGSPDGSTPYSLTFQGALAGTEVTEITAFAANLLAPSIAVSQVVKGLHGNTKYAFRLVATRPTGGFALTSAQGEFTTLASAPTVSGTTASAITATSAKLEGEVNPENQATAYQFEYLTQAAYEANGNSFSGFASKVPASPANIGSGIADVSVAEQIVGLEPGTAYRFRLVADNDPDPEAGTTAGAEATFTTHSGSQAFDPCANDQFRTGPSADLPDCRAYEQASPVDKNGGSIMGSTVSARTAEDGSTITFESTTGVPGGSGSAGKVPTYLARRGDGEWSTTGLLPNPSSGQRAAVLGWTADFATVFDRAELLSEGTSFLARDSASGAQAEIVPHTPPPNNPAYGYVDSSANGETTIFEAQPQGTASTLQLTPTAAAGKPNLYAWDGTLHLAGVLPDGTTPAEGTRAGRGMDARDYYRDTGLVAEDGSVFFNDAGSGQLYLRLNPTAEEAGPKDGEGNCIPDSVHACSVHVSASRKTNGEGPDGTDAAGPHPATFRAASSDGSMVTFTSSEKLTDDANTGPEPEAPTISRAAVSEPPCAPAPCETNLESLLAFAGQIAVDAAAGHIYWSDPQNGRIGRAKLDGTEVDEDYLPDLGKPLGIAVVNTPTAEYIFWTEEPEELDEKGKVLPGKGTIGRADLDGSDVEPDCYTGLTNPRSIAADANYVYWTMPVIGSNAGDTGRGEVTCDQLSLDEKFISGLGTNGDITVNASHIYISTLSAFGNSFVNRYDLNGAFSPMAGEPKVTGTNSALGLALDGSHLYWTDEEYSRVGRSLLDGTSQEYDFIPAAGPAEDPARGGDYLFWTAHQNVDPNPGTDLYQLDRASDELVDLAPDASAENGAEVQGVLGASADGSHVYFAANGVPDNLAIASNANGEEAEPGNCKGELTKATGVCNLYLWRDDGSTGGETIFISHLIGKESESSDAVNWATGGEGLRQESERTARVSEDGRVLVFRSSLRLTEYDNEGPRCEEFSGTRVPGPCREFYRFDYDAMELACLSCDPRGATPERSPRLASVRPPTTGAVFPASTWGRNLSRDGNRFFFETADALVAADTNGRDGCPAWGGSFQAISSLSCQDVYEWEAPGTGSCHEDSPAYSAPNAGCIYLISTGKSKEATFFADADPEGKNVFIYSYEQLVPQDIDALMDVYDARIGGGLAAQHAIEAPACAGDACRAEPLAPPPTQAPGSSGFAGPTDPKPQRAKQRKRKRRKQARQRRRRAAKAKQRARQKQRAAKQSGRAGR